MNLVVKRLALRSDRVNLQEWWKPKPKAGRTPERQPEPSPEEAVFGEASATAAGGGVAYARKR